ncbi:MAG: polysaccharide biosynthesis protein [Verrucomicrobiales bacterium]|nr:polysaccharide biosynthesis protein [Verrucomicrobiales bacterium]
MKILRRIFHNNFLLRRILAFCFHLVGVAVCYLLAFFLRFDFEIPEAHISIFWETLPLVIVSFMLCIAAFGLYRGLWRFFTLRDCVITAIALATGTILSGAVIFAYFRFTFEGVPRSVLIIVFLLFLAWEIGGRGAVRLLRESGALRRNRGTDGRRVLLIGAPEEADALLRAAQRNSSQLGSVVGIVSDVKLHHGSQLRGVSIYAGLERIGDLIEELSVSTLLFLPPLTGPAGIRRVIDELSARQIVCDYRVIPSIDEIASGKLDVSAIRKVSIEDLLYRVPYENASETIAGSISGKRILVSGAGGSIGSEICRQLIKYRPAVIVLFEVSEFHLFTVEREIAQEAKEAGVEVIARAGDVRSAEHLRQAIRAARGIDIFFHAAAYKHVDLMERNPVTCIHNNVIGTHVAACVAEEEGVDSFVLISTDKAVRPTSLMGASKRLAERVLIERPVSGTSYKAVRFGNVLGSNGSVIPIFREQIAKGGPVTVTSRDVTRFFMTIPEAVELVLAAGVIDEDRRIFVLEMGESVKIDTMARRMIELSGFIPDVEIPILYTGLKKGEKEYEELLTDDESVVRTDLDRIWVLEKNSDPDMEPVDLGRLFELMDDADEEGLRDYVHSLIPGSRLF